MDGHPFQRDIPPASVAPRLEVRVTADGIESESFVVSYRDADDHLLAKRADDAESAAKLVSELLETQGATQTRIFRLQEVAFDFVPARASQAS